MILALDIGGVNIKAAAVKAGEVHRFTAACTHYFPIWKLGKERLVEALNQVNKTIGAEYDAVALTMTAELSDVYRTKREGVEHILHCAVKTYQKKEVYVLNNQGNLIGVDEAIKSFLEVAGANWLATAWMAGKLLKNCIMIDVGSTTTDIIPILGGKVAAKGRTDLERLQNGELVYTGALRTNLASLAKRVPVNGILTPVSAEYFASTGDIHLILKHIGGEEFTVETADGRGKSVEEAYARLARIVCADIDMLNKTTLDKMATYLYRLQLKQITEALKKVISRIEVKGRVKKCLTLGIGRRFLAKPAAVKLKLKPHEMSDLISINPNIPETAVALAWLAASKLVGDGNLCM
ncbi:MAG: hydantoinase/oxoprolinase family protein [Nitrososphaerales archaeon]